MNKLPVELMISLFSHLNLKDKLNCRVVSKKFLNILDNLIIDKEIFILDHLNSLVPKKLKNNKRLIDHNNLIVMVKKPRLYTLFNHGNIEEPFYDLNFLLKNRYFKNTKSFCIDLDGKIDTNIFNNFKMIKSLNIYAEEAEPTILMLPKLKKLAISCSLVPLDFCTQNLEFLEISGYNSLKFKSGFENVKELRIYLYFPKKLEISGFKKLKYLYCDSFYFRDYMDEIFELPELEKVNLLIGNGLKNLPAYDPYFKAINFSLNKYKNYYYYYSKIYFHGIPFDKFVNQFRLIIASIDFDRRKILNEKTLEFYLANYSSIFNSIDNIVGVDFSSCEEYFIKDKVPSTFLKKLLDLHEIRVFKKVDKKVFVNFLKGCKINKLSLINSSFDQDFYSNLNLIIPWLNIIEIEDEQSVIGSLDFSFFEKFKFLTNFQIQNSINHKFNKMLIRKIKEFNLYFLIVDSRDPYKNLNIKKFFSWGSRILRPLSVNFKYRIGEYFKAYNTKSLSAPDDASFNVHPRFTQVIFGKKIQEII